MNIEWTPFIDNGAKCKFYAEKLVLADYTNEPTTTITKPKVIKNGNKYDIQEYCTRCGMECGCDGHESSCSWPMFNKSKEESK